MHMSFGSSDEEYPLSLVKSKGMLLHELLGSNAEHICHLKAIIQHRWYHTDYVPEPFRLLHNTSILEA